MASAEFVITLRDDSAAPQQPQGQPAPSSGDSSRPVGTGEPQASTSPARPMVTEPAAGGPGGSAPPEEGTSPPRGSGKGKEKRPSGKGTPQKGGDDEEESMSLLESLGIDDTILDAVGGVFPKLGRITEAAKAIGGVTMPGASESPQPTPPISKEVEPQDEFDVTPSTAPARPMVTDASNEPSSYSTASPDDNAPPVTAGPPDKGGDAMETAAGLAEDLADVDGVMSQLGAAGMGGTGAAGMKGMGGMLGGVSQFAGPLAAALTVTKLGREAGEGMGGDLAQSVGAPRGIGEFVGGAVGQTAPVLTLIAELTGVTDALKLLSDAVMAVNAEYDRQSELLAGYSPELAIGQATTATAFEMQKLDRAGKIGAGLAEFQSTKSDFEATMFDIWTEILAIGVDIFEELKPFFDEIDEIAEDVRDFIVWFREEVWPFVKPVLEFLVDSDPTLKTLEFLGDIADYAKKILGIQEQKDIGGGDFDPWLAELLSGMEGAHTRGEVVGFGFGGDSRERGGGMTFPRRPGFGPRLPGGMP